MVWITLKKLLEGLFTLWVVASLTFFLIRLLPGGPFQDPRVPPAMLAALEAKYHLNAPMVQQYGYYLLDLAKGDFGPSLIYEARSVVSILVEGLGASLLVGLPALFLGTAAGVLMGALSVFIKLPGLNAGLNTLAMSALATPSFIAAGLLVLGLAIAWPVFPAAAVSPSLNAYALPIITLALSPMAFAFFLSRTAMREGEAQNFVQHKLRMGLPQFQLALFHVVRNAWMPLVSLLGPLAANLLTGSFAIETIFAIPGLGRHFVHAVLNRDYTLVVGITLLYSSFLIALNMLTDLVLVQLDPRLKTPAKA